MEEKYQHKKMSKTKYDILEECIASSNNEQTFNQLFEKLVTEIEKVDDPKFNKQVIQSFKVWEIPFI